MSTDLTTESPALRNPRYEHRVQLVTSTIQAETNLDEQRAREVAVQVLRVIDHVPEKMP